MVGLIGLVLAQGNILNVSAAASLKESFTEIARNYEAQHPGLKVALNFAGSQTLASQINQGAPVDVFASAAAKNAKEVRSEPDSWRVFVENRLEIVTRKGFNRVHSPKDLPNASTIIIAAEAVPAGHYALEFFNRARIAYGDPWLKKVQSSIVSRELDVRSVLTKIRLGEADAGIVYVSDAISARGTVGDVAIPDALNQVARYPVEIPSSAPNKKEAKSFIKFLFSKGSQAVLEKNGFISPLRPAGFLAVMSPFQSRSFKLPLPSALKMVSVKATDHSGKTSDYKGVSVLSVTGTKDWNTATIIGADDYSRSFTKDELSQSKAVLIKQADGNYQLIVPGHKQDSWIQWIRRIELK